MFLLPKILQSFDESQLAFQISSDLHSVCSFLITDRICKSILLITCLYVELGVFSKFHDLPGHQGGVIELKCTCIGLTLTKKSVSYLLGLCHIRKYKNGYNYKKGQNSNLRILS